MKKILSLLLLIVMVLPMSACGDNKKDKLYVYNWGEYMDKSVIKKFEKENNCKVYYSEFNDNESMYAQVAAGGSKYDVVFPSEYTVIKMIQNDMLLPLNYANIPNYEKNVDQNLKTMIYGDGKDLGVKMDQKYSVPYFWGTVGILYNTNMVEEKVDSWSILFDEKYKGKIIMPDSERDIFVPALCLLGYSINTSNADELDEAEAMLIKQKPLVRGYLIDQARSIMVGEGAAMSVVYSGEAVVCAEEVDFLEYVVPKEGSNVWFDAVCIPKTAQNKELAEKFINFLYDPEIAKLNAEYSGYSTPNAEAYKLLDTEVQEDTWSYPGDYIYETCEVFQYLGQEVEELYNSRFKKIKGE